MSRRSTRRNPIPPGGEEARVERVNAPAVAIAATAPNKTIPMEDFGRDKDLKNLLRNLLPKAFTGEGEDVPKNFGRMDSIHGRLLFPSTIQFHSPRTHGQSQAGWTSQALVEAALPDLE